MTFLLNMSKNGIIENFYILRCYNELNIVQGMKKSNFFLQDLSIYKVQKVHILIQTECVPLQYFLDQDSLCLSRAVSLQ